MYKDSFLHAESIYYKTPDLVVEMIIIHLDIGYKDVLLIIDLYEHVFRFKSFIFFI